MSWEIVDSGAATAEENMEIDRQGLEFLSNRKQPQIRFYQWKQSSITYGYFTQPFDHLNRQFVEDHEIELARRPTGGGIVFHQYDFPFSILVPSSHPTYSNETLENYATINRIVASVVEEFLGEGAKAQLLQKGDRADSSFCYAKPTVYDVMIDGKKVGGAAQKRTKEGFLHQGTLLLKLPSEDFLSEILQQPVPLNRNSFQLLNSDTNEADCQIAKEQIKTIFIKQIDP